MDGTLESLIGLYVFTTGRRLFALRNVRAAAHAQGFTELVKHCDTSIAHDLKTRELERRWAGEPARSAGNTEATQIDNLVDKTLTAIRDHTLAQAQGAPSDDPIHAEAEALLQRIFPVGLAAVTSLPYIDELAAVDDIVTLFKGELAGAVKDLGLGRLVKRLEGLASKYRDALETPPPSLLDWGKVRAARSEGQGLLLEAVAIILGKHHQRSAEGMEARMALLGPILQQNEAIGSYLRARRSVTDVHPETGHEEPSSPGSGLPGGGGGQG
jgi:hypothetical protein